MDTLALFTAALNLSEPWKVSGIEFRCTDDVHKKMELHINVSFAKGGTFSCPCDGCNTTASAYDTSARTWRHLNFFQYKTYIHAELPRVQCGKHGVKTVEVPWARPGSGFTLLFEGWVVELSKHLPVAAIADMVEEHDTRLWRFIRYYVDKAREAADHSDTTGIGMDETSKKGHHYITVMVDLDRKKVLFVTEGKDATTVDRFCADFKAHGGDPDKIRMITCDMSLGFRKGIQTNFHNGSTVIDKFHVIKHANEAVDKVRKEETRTNHALKKTKYLWLKNDKNLTDGQRRKKESLMKKRLKTARAYSMRVELQDIYENAGSREQAEFHMKKLCSWMMHSRLAQMKDFCKLIRNHWNEIMNYFDLRYTNAILEGVNSIIQNIKRRARGFRNDEYFKTMIYLVCGQLDLDAIITVG